MLRKIAFSIVLLGCAATPALAQSMCSKPIPPAAIDGATATKAQIAAASHDANTFMKAVDDYQECISLEYQGLVTAAAADKKDVDPSIKETDDADIKDSQAMKVRVGAEFNASYAAYKKAHSGG